MLLVNIGFGARRGLGGSVLCILLRQTLDAKLMPLNSTSQGDRMKPFSEKILNGEVNVESFKEIMGKRWRYSGG